MSDRKHRRVENVRLVRMPDGRLVTQQNAVPQQQDNNLTQQQQQTTSSQNAPSHNTSLRSGKKQTRRQRKQDREIGDVWQEQMRIKEETERMELEYKLAKKMTKELRQKIRERDQVSSNYVDPVFSDLLSPEVKDFGKKLEPFAKKTKETAGAAKKRLKLYLKKSKLFGKIAAKNVLRISPKKLGVIGVSLVVVVAGGVFVAQKTGSKSKDVQSASDTQSVKAIPLNQTPSFQVLLPIGKTAAGLGGLAKVSPPNSAPAYAYRDAINEIPIRVSQQELPDSLKGHPDELEKTAKNFNATKLLQINDITAYIGLSDKGPQTVVFAKDNLLVFINSDAELSEVSWVQYISQLEKQTVKD